MESNIGYQEKLYRAVKLAKPQLWDDENGRPSSALFKDSKGVSVDRDGNRSEHEIINLLSENINHEPLRAVISLDASYCYEVPVELIYSPLENNIYHAEIHDSKERVQLTSSKARKLSRNCIVISID